MGGSKGHSLEVWCPDFPVDLESRRGKTLMNETEKKGRTRHTRVKGHLKKVGSVNWGVKTSEIH